MTLEDGIKLHEDKSETPSPQLSKSPPSAPINNWLGWLDETIQKEHINFYEYSSRFKNILKTGSGGSGEVYKATLDNSSICALKSYKHGSNIVDKEENYMQQKNEDSNSFSHPSIITTESTGTDSLQIKFDKILDL
ncbi:17072_t:CDS:2 [Entrophospora sp. SA101]|nr:17072_t:CDS:2 [Entrophospora sp. SA101]